VPAVPGVATGLAETPVGSDILFIETAAMPGSGRLILTGQLGEVMRESAQAALSLLKSRAGPFGLHSGAFGRDIHVDVPAGAIPKDGPPAGVTMFMSLTSLLLNRAIDPGVAMTGEISLRGLVLPVDDIREKVAAAARAGITTVVLPARNRRDWGDIPPSARDTLRFMRLETVGDALVAALPDGSGDAAISPGPDQAT
jgi:ATP-dependent Lon protease